MVAVLCYEASSESALVAAGQVPHAAQLFRARARARRPPGTARARPRRRRRRGAPRRSVARGHVRGVEADRGSESGAVAHAQTRLVLRRPVARVARAASGATPTASSGPRGARARRGRPCGGARHELRERERDGVRHGRRSQGRLPREATRLYRERHPAAPAPLELQRGARRRVPFNGITRDIFEQLERDLARRHDPGDASFDRDRRLRTRRGGQVGAHARRLRHDDHGDDGDARGSEHRGTASWLTRGADWGDACRVEVAVGLGRRPRPPSSTTALGSGAAGVAAAAATRSGATAELAASGRAHGDAVEHSQHHCEPCYEVECRPAAPAARTLPSATRRGRALASHRRSRRCTLATRRRPSTLTGSRARDVVEYVSVCARSKTYKNAEARRGAYVRMVCRRAGRVRGVAPRVHSRLPTDAAGTTPLPDGVERLEPTGDSSRATTPRSCRAADAARARPVERAARGGHDRSPATAEPPRAA